MLQKKISKAKAIPNLSEFKLTKDQMPKFKMPKLPRLEAYDGVKNDGDRKDDRK